MEQVSMSIVLLLGPRERVIHLQGFGDKNNSGCCYMRDLAKNVTARLSSASQVPQPGSEEESQPTLNLSNNKRSVQITEPTSDWLRSTPRPGEIGEEPTTVLESFTSSTKSNTSRNKRRRISEEKVAVSACPKIFPMERTSLTKGLGNLLREHRSRSTLQVNDCSQSLFQSANKCLGRPCRSIPPLLFSTTTTVKSVTMQVPNNTSLEKHQHKPAEWHLSWTSRTRALLHRKSPSRIPTRRHQKQSRSGKVLASGASRDQQKLMSTTG